VEGSVADGPSRFRVNEVNLPAAGRLAATGRQPEGRRYVGRAKASGPKGGPELQGGDEPRIPHYARIRARWPASEGGRYKGDSAGRGVRSGDEGAALKGRGAWVSAVIRLAGLGRGFLLLVLLLIPLRWGRVILVAWSIGGPRANLGQVAPNGARDWRHRLYIVRPCRSLAREASRLRRWLG
jgi:hypothetical protein